MHQKREDVKEQSLSEHKALTVQILKSVNLLATSEGKIFSLLMGHSRPYYTRTINVGGMLVDEVCLTRLVHARKYENIMLEI
jgi:hypothetical protein